MSCFQRTLLVEIRTLVTWLKSTLFLKMKCQETPIYMKTEYLQTKWDASLFREETLFFQILITIGKKTSGLASNVDLKIFFLVRHIRMNVFRGMVRALNDSLVRYGKIRLSLLSKVNLRWRPLVNNDRYKTDPSHF